MTHRAASWGRPGGLPGGPMATRPVHFTWLLDCSYSMRGDRIAQLNYAIREALPELRAVAAEQPAARLLLRALTFSTTAAWLHRTPVPVEDFTWRDVEVDGMTNLGEALSLAARDLRAPAMPARALKPVLALVTDGVPTDDWRAGLAAVDATPWGREAVRVAIAVGRDADGDVLRAFTGDPAAEPLRAHNGKQLAAAVRWASTTAVRAASQPVADPPEGAAGQPFAPPVLGGDEDDEVW
ncbi:tellurium resistance protein [Streptomyces griseoviridis]|uniref:Tellurium resistance protein TerY n=3 Tax=Streptomyces TaxID=1883 RepID=A0A918LGM0_STRGD|nr:MULTISPECIES: tellurium resistance protein [Streptomyces]GGS44580.1 tellurium resistance protein TerY [Streptomyces niveoruber]GGU47387.1 tellurium resistance protein TerY [Streptomyces daghestanicus]GHI30246.1 tellurium resistance protein TerY [Streptomyces daghestanicus]